MSLSEEQRAAIEAMTEEGDIYSRLATSIAPEASARWGCPVVLAAVPQHALVSPTRIRQMGHVSLAADLRPRGREEGAAAGHGGRRQQGEAVGEGRGGRQESGSPGGVVWAQHAAMM